MVEVLVCLFILSVVAGPLVSLLTFALQEYREAWDKTEAVHAAQSLMEPLLDPTFEFPAGTPGFAPHPTLPQYEYRVTVMPWEGPALDRITVELRETGETEPDLVLTTLKARRRLYVSGP